MKRKSWTILLIAVLSIAFVLGIAGLCEYLFTRDRPKPQNETEIKELFTENRSDLNRCAELLYSKPDFWRRMDDTRTYNWSLRLDVDFYSEFFDEEEWNEIKRVVKKLNPHEVSYHISVIDSVTCYIEFSFLYSESKKEDVRSIDLCYMPANGLNETERQEIINYIAFRQVKTERIDNDWYCRIDEGWE